MILLRGLRATILLLWLTILWLPVLLLLRLAILLLRLAVLLLLLGCTVLLLLGRAVLPIVLLYRGLLVGRGFVGTTGFVTLR